MPKQTKSSQQTRQRENNTPRSYASVGSPDSGSIKSEQTQREPNSSGQQTNLVVNVERQATSTVFAEYG